MIRKKGYIVLYIYWILLILDVSGQDPSPTLPKGDGVEYIKAVTQGLRFQIQADSMLRLIDAQNALLSTAPQAAKRGIQLAILNYDIQALKYQKSADEQFQKAISFKEMTTKSAVSLPVKPISLVETFGSLSKPHNIAVFLEITVIKAPVSSIKFILVSPIPPSA